MLIFIPLHKRTPDSAVFFPQISGVYPIVGLPVRGHCYVQGGIKMKKTHQVKGVRGNFRLGVACLVAILAFGIANFGYADAGCCLASASASGIKAKTPVISKTIGSASIGCNGGNKTSSFGTIEIPGLLNAVAVQTSASGTVTQTNSQSTVDNITVIAGSNLIKAAQISSNAQASCTRPATANSIIQRLTINGRLVNISGEPNQVIQITGGKITINAQKFTGSGCVKNVSVTALKISVLGIADISLSTSQAGVACVVSSCK